MNAASTLMLASAAVAFASGGVFMKYSQGLTRFWPSVAVFALFCAGAALQARGMRHNPMSVSYIVVLGLESVLAFFLGISVFSEPANLTRVFAVALITAGIVLLRL